MFKKILIANRGEIACRIADTCRRLGVAAATIHSDADRDALHVRRIGESVRVGPAPASQSYLDISAIVAAARAVGAEAVHPGIGFLSENADFAQAVEDAGLVFIGPRPDTMRRFADKASAKREAVQAQVQVIDGGTRSWSSVQEVAQQVHAMRLPVMLKAVAGGGGRGVRVVASLERLEETIESAMREAQASFGLPDLLVEQFIDRPRHIEVQVAGDGEGGVLHLFERECSLQRRFQKVIEEAPAAALSDDTRRTVLEAAVRLARRVAYRGLGTMEFLVAGDNYWFLECNPRLQVEHTVTEEVCGLDLVELQLRIAHDGRLPFGQDAVHLSGHAVQARVYAEDPEAGFMPSAGRLLAVSLPADGCRVDAGVDTGSEITPHYDAMVAKVVARADTRSQAIARLRAALERCVLLGVKNNLAFLCRLLDDPAVLANEVDNRTIDRELARLQGVPEPSPQVLAAAAAVWLGRWHPAEPRDPWSGHAAWRLDDGLRQPSPTPSLLLQRGERQWGIALAAAAAGDEANGETRIAVDGQLMRVRLRADAVRQGLWHALVDGTALPLHVVAEPQALHLQLREASWRLELLPYLPDASREEGRSGRLTSPLMGKIIKVNVRPGDAVRANEPLIVLESMKMEISIDAPHDGQVAALHCEAGDLVERHALLAVVE